MTLRASRLLLMELRASTALRWLPCALSRPLGCLLEAGRLTEGARLPSSWCWDHRLDPSEDRRGSVILSHHGFDGVEERFGDEDVLLRCDEDVLITRLGLQDLLVNAPTPSN